MPTQFMVNMLIGLLLALLSLAGVANAQDFVPGDSTILVSGDAPLVDQFEKDLKKVGSLPQDCRSGRFLNTTDPVTKKEQGGLLLACKSKDATKSYEVVGLTFLLTTKNENQKHLLMAHTILQSCPDMQDNEQCQTYPCPARPGQGHELPGYYFGCFHAGNACQEAHECTKKK